MDSSLSCCTFQLWHVHLGFSGTWANPCLNSNLINPKGARWLHPTGGFSKFNVNQAQTWLAKRQIFAVMKKQLIRCLLSRFWATLGRVSTDLKDDAWLKWPGVTHPEHNSTYAIHMFRNYAFHIIDKTDSNLHNVFVFRLPILLFTPLSAAWKTRNLILRAVLCHLVG